MRAMLLEAPGRPLRMAELPVPEPGPGQVLLRVRACAVCRTDLHVIDGELPRPKLPLVPGHEIVGRDRALRSRRGPLPAGPAGRACRGSAIPAEPAGTAAREAENLCDAPGFTGYTIDGGYAEYAAADAAYCFPLPGSYSDVEAAPLLCAGLIGYRSLAMAGDAQRLGIYGFGAAAHIVAQVASFQGRRVYAFTRPGDCAAQEFARALGAAWAGGSDESAARAARRRADLRAGGRPGAGRAGRGPQGRHGGAAAAST